MQRYFVTKEPISNVFFLEGNDVHHIVNVMRFKQGDNIIVIFNNEEYKCIIDSINKKTVQVKIIEKNTANVEKFSKVILYIATLKNDKLSFAIQKATELGVKEINIVNLDHSSFSIKKSELDSKMNRWNKIAKEASEQSNRIYIPSINFYDSLKNCFFNENRNKIVFYEKSQDLILKSNVDVNIDTSIFIGPEGGFSQKEISFLQDHNFLIKSLGKTILKVETALISGISIITYLYNISG